MPFKRGFKANANRIAIGVREKLGLAPTAPIDPWEVAELYSVQVIRLSDLDVDCSRFLEADTTEFSAVTVPCGAQTAIVHNDAHHVHRQRSNICHELAHLFLGHKAAPPLTEGGHRHHDGEIEAEANFLAGSLLLTNEGALHVLKQGLVGRARTIYGVSQAMLDYRMRVSGAETIFRRSMLSSRPSLA